jgi:DNA-binding XRE family transcriptional regulator
LLKSELKLLRNRRPIDAPLKTLAEQLVRHRTTLGMSQKKAAEHIGVDPGTLARWERASGSQKDCS